LVRNGMLIARHDSMLSPNMDSLRKNTDYEPFFAVIDIDKSKCPELFQLVRRSESAYHDKLETELLPEKQESKLKSLLKELSEQISQRLIAVSREGFSLDLPFLEISWAQTEASNSSVEKPSSQTPAAKKGKKKKKIVVKPKPGNGKKRKAPEISSRELDSRNLSRLYFDGEKHKLSLNTSPLSDIDTRDEIYFSLTISTDSDTETSGALVDMSEVYVDDELVDFNVFYTKDDEEKTDFSQINLGKFNKGANYKIDIVFETPNKLSNTKFGVEPYFGLKQKKSEKR